MVQMNRRGFLAAMTAAGAAFGFPLTGMAAMDPAQADGLPLQPEGVRFDPTVWYWIDGTGHVNVHITRAEMGQHVGTAIARILADDLGADWTKVSIEHVDTEAKYGYFVTGGSWSIMQSWDPYRRAGTAGRIALAEKAAALWGVSVDDVKIENGIATAGSNTATIGELVTAGIERSFTDEELAALTLKPHSEMTMIGKEVAALDIDGKTTGKAIFGLDAKVEGMVHGAPILPPTRYGSKVTSIDDSAAKEIKGYQQSIALEDPTERHAQGWVMVIADTFWAAKKAATLVKVTWDSPKAITVQEADIQAESRRLIEDPTSGALLDMGDSNVDPVFETAASTVEAEYTTSTVLHFQMEPLNAMAFRNAEGIWEIHTGNQWQSMTQPWIETALGVAPGEVIMRSYMLGGGFGRRLGGDYAIPAALASKALDGKPVKVILSREADATFDSVRSPSVSKFRMAFDGDKKVVAMDTACAAGWPTKEHAPEALGPGTNGVAYDPFAIDGADHWYTVGAHRVRAICNELAQETFRPGWLRSVSPGWINFGLESFMDEAAAHAGMDPVEFRLAQFTAEGINAGTAPLSVGGATRQANVLKRLAEKVGTPELEADTAIGFATTFGQSRSMPTWTACAAQVHVDRTTGQPTVQKLWLVIDCGTVVDPGGALAQTQGGALWGVSMALFEGTEIENGQPKARNLDAYTPLRLHQTPEMDIEFVASTEAPVGLGEPGTTVVGPAIGNAIFKAVGARMRHLPIKAEDVLAQIK